MSATRVVVEMYERFPEIYFIDERDEGKNVKLIFEFNKISEELKDWLNRACIKHYVYANRLYVIAREDY